MKEKKILYIQPIKGNEAGDAELEAFLNEHKSSSTTHVDVVSFKQAPSHLEHHFYEALVAKDILKTVRQAEIDGYDAAVIGCFYDPFLDIAKEISQGMPVTAPAEASMHIAATIANSFSIIVGRNKWIPKMHENVVRYGYRDYLASFRPLGIGVLDFQADKERTERLMREEIKKAIEQDRAEAIILGCTMEFGFFRKLQEEFALPVIDCALASLKYAEHLADLREVCGWTISKIGGFDGPAKGELKSWGVEAYYGLEGMF
ncbi:MAG: aspartate/glutamate racemase family protein [Oscillospiraceae bacterium]|nr:aspartate/glutamate racemase family protein [Oscillospiraceae bacterium]